VIHANHFRRELLPPVRDFYSRVLGKLSRPSRDWAKANCPFHPSKSKTSFSVNLVTGGFYCHGCGAKGGDLAGFVMLRDGLNFKAAAQSLGAWDEAPSPETVRKIEQAQRERDRQRDQALADKELDRRRRIQIRNQLLAASWAYTIVNERLSQLRQGATPDWPDEAEACWASLALTNGDFRKLDREYCSAAELEYAE
jgi:CHC2 zinc finger